jgi:hypothetical protein
MSNQLFIQTLILKQQSTASDVITANTLHVSGNADIQHDALIGGTLNSQMIHTLQLLTNTITSHDNSINIYAESITLGDDNSKILINGKTYVAGSGSGGGDSGGTIASGHTITINTLGDNIALSGIKFRDGTNNEAAFIKISETLDSFILKTPNSDTIQKILTTDINSDNIIFTNIPIK